jgi:hypothetical protein
MVVWLDQTDVTAGAQWHNGIKDALISCPAFLVILSPSSVNSQNIMDEVALALDEQKKEIIPVLHRKCKIPFRLSRFQYVDFRTDYDGD